MPFKGGSRVVAYAWKQCSASENPEGCTQFKSWEKPEPPTGSAILAV